MFWGIASLEPLQDDTLQWAKANCKLSCLTVDIYALILRDEAAKDGAPELLYDGREG
jgi:hypothetical protein